MEADAPVDDIDIITAGVDELGENDQFAVLKALVRNADVEGVQRHLEVLDYNGATVSARSLGLAARLPLTVHYGDAAVHERSRAVMLLVVAACNEQTLGQCVVNTTHWTHEYARAPRFSVPAVRGWRRVANEYDDIRGYGPAPIRMGRRHGGAGHRPSAVRVFCALGECNGAQ